MHKACAALASFFVLSVAPSAAATNSPDYKRFMNLVQQDMRLNWFPPLTERPFRTVLIFKLHADGNVSDLKVLHSSGNSAIDKAGCEAVLAATPILPTPPGAQTVDIEFSFDQNDWTNAMNAALLKNPHLSNREEIEHPQKHVAQAASNAFVDEAKKLVTAGQLEPAIEKLRRAIKLDDANRYALFVLAKVYYLQAMQPGRSADEQINLLRQSLAQDAAYGKARAALNARLAKSGIDPVSALQRASLAKQLQAAGKLEDARVELDEAMRIDDKSAAVQQLRNDVAKRQNAQSDLVRWQETIKRSDSAESRAGLARAYENLGDTERALEEYRRALQMDSNYEFARQALNRLQRSDKSPQ